MSSSRVIARDEFIKHDTLGDCWIEIEGSVYDVSEWMRKHPGGERLLECLGGKDASLPFLLNHKPWIREKYLKSMLIGTLPPKGTPNKYDALTADFKALYHDLVAKGWFETSTSYYAKKMGVLIAMLLTVLWLFRLGRTTEYRIFFWLGSFIVGMFWQQAAFIGHDMGHNAITHSVFWDTVFGLFIGNFLNGISMGWWKYTHNVHHVRTNDAEWDPDIQHMPVIAITEQYLEKLYSKFHRHSMPPTGTLTAWVSRVSIRYQHLHWFFTIGLSRLFVYISSMVFVFVQQPKRVNGRNEPWKGYNVMECVSLLGYHVWTLSLFYVCTDSVWNYLIAYAVAGILHIQIIMNHFPCPVFDGLEEGNFVVHQLRSSMAIKSNTKSHWFYGGLQFQVEHHLFPMMPRHNLRLVKPFVLELCEKYDIPYLEAGFWEACGQIFTVLKDVAEHTDVQELTERKYDDEAAADELKPKRA